MKCNTMQLVTFLRSFSSICYRRCVYFVFLLSVPIATPYASVIATPVNKNKSGPLPPEALKEINDHANEYVNQDVAQPQFIHESTVDPKIDKTNPPQLKFEVESPEKFIWFIHNVIKILSNYGDTDLKHFFHIINTEVERYEKSESNHLSRFLSSELNKVKNMSAIILRKQLLKIDALMEKENKEKSQKQLTDYINSLYGGDYVEKFLMFLFNIDDYKFLITKNIDLGLILSNGLKSVIIDRYNKLDYATRETFILSIKRYFMYITNSPSLIGGNEREDVDERDFKLSGGNNYTAINMKGMHDDLVKNHALENVKGMYKARGKSNYKEKPYVHVNFTKNPIVSTWSTVAHTLRHQTEKTPFKYSPIKSLETVNIRSLLTKKATLKSKNTGKKTTTSKRNIFIDIEYPKHLKVPLEHKVQRKINKPVMRLDSKYPKLSTTKHSYKLDGNLPAESTYKGSRGKFPILTKRFDLSVPQKVKEKVDYRRKNDGNEAKDRFEIKKKVLTRLYQLENDIKLVKSQIYNDSRTIKDLENQIHQKEKERAKLNLIKHKKYIMEKHRIEEKYSSGKKAMRRQFQGQSLEKITESNRLTSNYDQFEKNKIEGTSDKIYETKQNTSYDENIPDFPGESLNIFDRLDDVKYETFETYDGEFDWEKFVTSNIYFQELKNSTAEILDGRRMLDEELTTPRFNPEKHPPIESLNDSPELGKVYDMDEPRESTIFTPPLRNKSLDHLVPKPEVNRFIDSMGISLEFSDPLNMKKSEDTELKDDFASNLRLGPMKRPRMLTGGHNMRPMVEIRRNIMYTSTSTYDKVLDDPIIRDIDKAIEF